MDRLQQRPRRRRCLTSTAQNTNKPGMDYYYEFVQVFSQLIILALVVGYVQWARLEAISYCH